MTIVEKLNHIECAIGKVRAAQSCVRNDFETTTVVLNNVELSAILGGLEMAAGVLEILKGR